MTDLLEDIGRLNAIEAQRRAAKEQEQAAREQTEAAKSLKALVAGVKTITGNDGATGSQGPKGDRGPQGDTGPRGPKGVDGTNGRDGATGSQGPKGGKGDPGKDGVGPDEQVRITKGDPKAGYLADKLKGGLGVTLRTEKDTAGDRIFIDAHPQAAGMAGGSGTALVGIHDNGVNRGQASIIDFGDNLDVALAAGVATVTGSTSGGGSVTPAVDPSNVADPTIATPESVALKLNTLMGAMRTAGLLA